MSMVGSIYRQLGRFDSAIEWHEKALELRIEVLGEDHIGLSSDLIAIDHIHYCQRKLDFSLAAFSECIALQNRSLPAADNTSIADPGLLTSIWYKTGQICTQLEDGPNEALSKLLVLHLSPGRHRKPILPDLFTNLPSSIG